MIGAAAFTVGDRGFTGKALSSTANTPEPSFRRFNIRRQRTGVLIRRANVDTFFLTLPLHGSSSGCTGSSLRG